MTIQDNLSMMPRVVEITLTSRLRDFLTMKSSIFRGSRVNDDPQEFLDGVYKVLSSIGITFKEKAELSS